MTPHFRLIPGPRTLLAALAAAMLATLFCLCPRAGEAADRQLTLRLLIWDGYAPAAVRNEFVKRIRQKYRVDLAFEITSASNPDNFYDNLRLGRVDMISPAHNLPKDTRFNLTTNGLTLPVNLDNIPNYKKLRPDLKRREWAMENGRIYAVPVVNGIYGLAYNLEEVTRAPDSWDIFWDPEFRGRYMVHGDYYELNVYIAALAIGFGRQEIFRYDKIKGGRLENKLHHLVRHAKALWRGFDKPEHYRDIALATTWRVTFPREDPAFDTWRVAVPGQGTTFWTDAMMISHTLAGRPLAKRIAEEWINTLLSPAAQINGIARQLGTCPVTIEAFDTYTRQILRPEERETLYRIFEKKIPWQILATRDRNAFKLLWQEALDANGGSNE